MNAKPIAMSILWNLSCYVDFCRLQRVCRSWRAAGIAVERDSGKSEVEFALTFDDTWMLPSDQFYKLTPERALAVYSFGRRHALAYLIAVRPEQYMHEGLWNFFQTDSKMLSEFNRIHGHPEHWWEMVCCPQYKDLEMFHDYPFHVRKFILWGLKLAKERAPEMPPYRSVGTQKTIAQEVSSLICAHLIGRLSKEEFTIELERLLEALVAAMNAHHTRTSLIYNTVVDIFPHISDDMDLFLWEFIDCADINNLRFGATHSERYNFFDKWLVYPQMSAESDDYMRCALIIMNHSVKHRIGLWECFNAWKTDDWNQLVHFCTLAFQRDLTLEGRQAVLEDIAGAGDYWSSHIDFHQLLGIPALDPMEKVELENAQSLEDATTRLHQNGDFWWWYKHYVADRQTRYKRRRRC